MGAPGLPELVREGAIYGRLLFLSVGGSQNPYPSSPHNPAPLQAKAVLLLIKGPMYGRGWGVGSPSTRGEGGGVGALLLHPIQAHPKPTVISSPEVKKEKSLLLSHI